MAAVPESCCTTDSGAAQQLVSQCYVLSCGRQYRSDVDARLASLLLAIRAQY